LILFFFSAMQEGALSLKCNKCWQIITEWCTVVLACKHVFCNFPFYFFFFSCRHQKPPLAGVQCAQQHFRATSACAVCSQPVGGEHELEVFDVRAPAGCFGADAESAVRAASSAVALLRAQTRAQEERRRELWTREQQQQQQQQQQQLAELQREVLELRKNKLHLLALLDSLKLQNQQQQNQQQQQQQQQRGSSPPERRRGPSPLTRMLSPGPEQQQQQQTTTPRILGGFHLFQQQQQRPPPVQIIDPSETLHLPVPVPVPARHPLLQISSALQARGGAPSPAPQQQQQQQQRVSSLADPPSSKYRPTTPSLAALHTRRY
jgi:hypothetical protein